MRSASVALNILAFVGRKWEVSRTFAGSGVKATLLSCVQVHSLITLISREGNARLSGEWLLSQHDCYMIPISFLKTHGWRSQNYTFPNLLLFTEMEDQIRLGVKVWLLFFYNISSGFAWVPGPRELPCRVQCKLIPCSSMVSSFQTQVLGELFIVFLLQIPPPFASSLC